MVESLEETRTELTFVTELISSSLGNILNAAQPKSRGGGRPPGSEERGEVDLDEVEIQKGVLQVAKGLSFLHTQARMVHLNISPDAILVNAKVSRSCYLSSARDARAHMAGRLEAVWLEPDYPSRTAGRNAYEILLPGD